MKTNFMISIITPFYKGNKYLAQLFKVIQSNYEKLKEKYPQAEIELIIVNDSPDIEVEIPKEKFDFQYIVENHWVNSGIHQARVTGLKNCSGEYILFLDQDDVLVDNAIVSQMKIIENYNADIVICNAYLEDSNRNCQALYKTKTEFQRLNDLRFYLKSHNVIKSPGQCIIKKECIPKEWQMYIMKKNGSDDLFLWILLLETGHKFVINKEILYIHKYTGENLSESESKMNLSSLEIVDFLRKIDYVSQKDVSELKRAREFRVEIRKSNWIRKILLMLKNADLVLYLIYNKMKKVFI